MKGWSPERIFVEEGSREYPLARKILSLLEGVPVETVGGPDEIAEELKLRECPVSAGKRWLFLARRKGPFVKPCPCTPGHVRCGYFVINLDWNCPLDCSYCILQHYLNPSVVTVHVNLDALWPELDRITGAWTRGVLRIGTGELGDSLALDHLTGNSRSLIDYFRERNGVYLELKTKTTNIANVLESEPAPNVVISWSLNSESAAGREEKGAPAVGQRLEAAGRVSSRGFPVGFHFDPLILEKNWRKNYGETVRRMIAAVEVERIAWISLGSLRFHPALKFMIRKRFPESRIPGEELHRGRDGKMRYFRPARIVLYEEILNMIREAGGGRIPVYLCMESPQVWSRVFEKKNGERKTFKTSFPRPSLRRNLECEWD